jgi:ATP phosphoribosyltransferase regulatory subunit
VDAKTSELRAIFAPASGESDLAKAIEALRANGERVIQALPGQTGGAAEMGCDHELVLKGGKWLPIALRK